MALLPEKIFDPDKSDIDIMVELNGDAGYEFIELAEELERLLGRKVDLVSRNGLKQHHWEYFSLRGVFIAKLCVQHETLRHI